MDKSVKIIKAVFNLLCGLGNILLVPYVVWKIYGYYSPEVGFVLPALTYLNVFAINALMGWFTFKPMKSMYIQEMHSLMKKEDTSDSEYGLTNFKITMIALIGWLFSWLIYIIVF